MDGDRKDLIRMQYYKPKGSLFVGDCMPFFHDGVFHLYYLVDENHHQGKGGLGGHQWAHASSTDLVHWTHHPLAIGIEEEWECSICTGSVFWHQGVYHAYYATRKEDRSEHLSLATSADGVRYTKMRPNPFASPPPGYTGNYRDPCVFADANGRFHMLVTAATEHDELPQARGCLAHLISGDLKHWQQQEPFLVPGYLDQPECADYFYWNGWYYLIFSNGGMARYRMSRQPEGPWLRPIGDALECPIARVLKSAAFTGNRRLGVAYLASRQDDKDRGALLYAGNAVFHELVQFADGRLGTKFPQEMIPASGPPQSFVCVALSDGVTRGSEGIMVAALEGFGAAMIEKVPFNARITARVTPGSHTASYGLLLRGAGLYTGGCELRFTSEMQRVELQDQAICPVEGLSHPFDLDIVMHNDIIDVCIGQRHCLINRCPESRGDRLFLFCHNGEVGFEAIEIRHIY